MASGVLLAADPGPRCAGRAADRGIPGPFALVSRLPFFSGNRYPSRYSVMLMLAVAVLAGLGVAWLLGSIRPAAAESQRARLLVVAWLSPLFLFEHLSTPLPLNDFRVPAIYRRLAARTRGGFCGCWSCRPVGATARGSWANPTC